MGVSYGLVGLPNVGKSTLFNALSKGKALEGNYPFCTIKPNVGIAEVKDSRLQKIAHLVQAEKTIYATLTVKDIAGLVEGAHRGEGLGNQFLGDIRGVDAIIYVMRCFDNDDITHVAGGVDPVFDKALLDEELRLKDQAQVEGMLAKRQKQKNRSRGDGKELRAENLLERVLNHLKKGAPARHILLEDAEDVQLINSWQLLTYKPIIYVANVDEATLTGAENRHVKALKAVVEQDKSPLITLCATLEAELVQLPESERIDFLKVYDLRYTSLENLVRTSFEKLGLITYFTAGKKEARAWTILRGTLAPQAAGVIHSDFERTFIKAEVVGYTDYIAYGGAVGASEAGRLRLEGKTYVVADGDVIAFKCGR